MIIGLIWTICAAINTWISFVADKPEHFTLGEMTIYVVLCVLLAPLGTLLFLVMYYEEFRDRIVWRRK